MTRIVMPLDPRLPDDPETVLVHLLDAELRGDDLYPLMHQLRTLAPVFKSENEAFQKAWVITRFVDDDTVVRAKTLSSDNRVLEIFRGGTEGEEGAFFQVMKHLMKFLDPPDHARVRGLVARAFTPRSIEQLRPRIEEIVDARLDACFDAHRMDLVADFAFPIPVAVICELLGVPVEDVELFLTWSTDFAARGDVSRLSPEREKAGDEAAIGLRDYFKRLIRERRARPREDLISRLVAVADESRGLSEMELVGSMIILLQAGHETTVNLLGKTVLNLSRQPDVFRAFCERGPAVDAVACEEFLRFDTSVQITPKVATAEIAYHDRVIRPGDTVATFRGAVNRDPEQYAHPDRLDLDRVDMRHHSFGVGAYHCLGASLARAEIQIALRRLVTRIPNLAVETERPRYKPNLYLHGLEALEVSW